RRQSAPTDAASETELIEPLRRVFLNARSEHGRFPRCGGRFVAIEQIKDSLNALGTLDFVLGRDMLPGEQEALKFRDRNGLNFRPQSIDGKSMNAREQPAIAPFGFLRVGVEFSAQHESLSFEREQSLFNFA